MADAGLLNKCPECPVYKDSNYELCRACNKKSRTRSAKKKKSTPRKERATDRRYDFVEGETFTERTSALEDDRKAEDKRLLFHKQGQKCVYCGNKYRYDELEIEHMIPKTRGGPDHIRNCQLACASCNKAKGTMTDIEFREKHAKHLPQRERQPANPPIDPKLLRDSAKKTRRFYPKRRNRR
jgi:5-methylcytosine-specific restriction endonuclease McrA